ncbi:hypothetical protein EZV62_025308 [Acer yangbiense]|uniref:KOW domain-containing protein n=1 Tax=Acer yangbiense TaxID=1000413 RepID=A0A5C7GXF4_9ROSI|nr:hypothetical protein EZV62_025308 [Acer yangbiense]
MVDKGKKIAVGNDSAGKRKRGGLGDGDKSGHKNKRPGVLQFFEDAADVDEDEPSDDDLFDSMFDEDNVEIVGEFMDDELDTQPKVKNELGKAQNLPFIPKEEEIDEEAFDKIMEERFKQGSRFIKYAEDDYENKRLVDRDYRMPSSEDPTVWKVKCVVGREKHSAFCLMQKFVDLKSLGTKLLIISAFTVEHVKGFIYIEADKQCDVIEACKGLSGIYSSRMAPVLKNDVSYLLSAQSKCTEVSVGTWARVKNGKYKGDLAQIVAVNKERKRATVKLIPRIDLQSLAAKFGGGATIKKPASTAPRLISSSELEEFRPLIQYKRDRDTGIIFENLDGMMFKDGYLYKKVSMDSLSCWGVAPSEEELLKFAPSENNESTDLEWLSQLYGDEKKNQTKKQTVTVEKGGVKGEGSSSSSSVNFELYELVCFGRKDFGLIVGMEKDDIYKVLQEGSGGPTVATVERRNLKNVTSDMKFTTFDHCMKIISVNDTVKVSEGPSKGKQGVVKQIYRGIVFLYDENETENGGYICSKSQLCEKIKLFADACNEKGGGSGDLGFEEFPSSPKSPLSPKKPWQEKEFNSDSKRGDRDGMFSVGQALRIRVGPLKGYLCRVLAIRYSDVTVKLDSQQKVLTVRSEHLAEVRGKSFGMSSSGEPGSNSFKPFDPLGTEGGTGGWTNGAGTSAEGDSWNAGGQSSAERSSWPSFPAVGNDSKQDAEDSAWGSKGTANQDTSWGAAAADGKNDDSWNKAADKNIDSDINASGSWGKPVVTNGNSTGLDTWGAGKLPANSPNDASASWGKNKDVDGNQDSWKKSDSWDKGKNITGSSSNAWGDATAEKNLQEDSWGKAAEKLSPKDGSTGSNSEWNKSAPAAKHPTSSWGNAGGDKSQHGENTGGTSGWKDAQAASGTQTTGWGQGGSGNQDQTDSWNKSKALGADGGSSWNKQADQQGSKQDGGSSWGKQDGGGGSSWGKHDGGSSQGKQDGGSSWGKQDGGEGSSWGKKDGGSSQGKQDGGSSWGKQDAGGGSSWSKQDGGGSSWGKKDEGSSQDKQDGGSSWGKQDGGSSWGKQDGGGGSSWGKKDGSSQGKQDGGSSWGKQDGGGGSSWGKQDGGGGSTWGKQDGGGGSSWGKQDGASSQGKQDGGSSWGKQDGGGGSSWGKQDGGGSSWGKQDGGSSWSKQADQKDDSEKAQAFDGGRGSGGRWGRGRGRGGRDYSGNQSSWKEPNASGEEWNSGSNNSNQDSSWGKKADWNTGSGGGYQDSNWAKKSDWNSGNEDQNENRTSSGNWRGGSDDSDGSGRGSFRGRGGSDRGGYGGRGRSDRGGYGGRGRSDSGGYGGRGRSDRGGYRGGFGGRDGSDRGFGGRGRGRRDQDDWGTNNNDGAGSWSQGGGDNSQVKSWHSGNTSSQDGGGSSWGKQDGGSSWGKQDGGGGSSWGKQDGGRGGSSWGKQDGGGGGSSWGKQDGGGGSSWGKQDGGRGGSSWGKQDGATGDKDAGGSDNFAGNLNKRSDATSTAGWSQGNNGKSSDTSGGWNKGSDGSAQAGGWGNQGNASGNNDKPKSWNQSNAADGSQSSGWGQPKDAEQGSGGGQSSGWGQSKDADQGSGGGQGPSGSSWGKGSDGSGKGGW